MTVETILLQGAEAAYRRNVFATTLGQILGGLGLPEGMFSPDMPIYFVHSTKGSADNDGTSPDKALNSYVNAQAKVVLDSALSGFTNNAIIVGLPEHAETVATAGALGLDNAGIIIYQMGKGAQAATITINGVVGADIDFDAVDTYIVGGRIVAGLDNLTAPIDLNQDRCGLIGVELVVATAVTDAPTNWVTAAAKDKQTLKNCYLNSAVVGSTSLLAIPAAASNFDFTGNRIIGNFSTAIVNNTSAAYTYMLNDNPVLLNLNAAGLTFVRVAGFTEFQKIKGDWFMYLENRVADMSAAGVSEVNEHEVWTGTGNTHCYFLNRVDTALDSSGDALNITFGVTGDADRLIASTAQAVLIGGVVWGATTGGGMVEAYLVNGSDAGYAITDAAATAGAMTFASWHRPIMGGGKLVAATIAAGSI